MSRTRHVFDRRQHRKAAPRPMSDLARRSAGACRTSASRWNPVFPFTTRRDPPPPTPRFRSPGKRERTRAFAPGGRRTTGLRVISKSSEKAPARLRRLDKSRVRPAALSRARLAHEHTHLRARALRFLRSAARHPTALATDRNGFSGSGLVPCATARGGSADEPFWQATSLSTRKRFRNGLQP